MVRYFATLRFDENEKIFSSSILLCFFFFFREQSEDILALKGLNPGGTLPLGTLEGGKSAIEQGRTVHMAVSNVLLDLFLSEFCVSTVFLFS